MATRSKSVEIKFGGEAYHLAADFRALSRLSERLAGQRPDRRAYSYWDAISDLWRNDGGLLLINGHILTTFVWALLHEADRGDELRWCGQSCETVASWVDEFVSDAESIQAGETALFFVVLDALYKGKVIRPPTEDRQANPTEAAESAAAKAN